MRQQDKISLTQAQRHQLHQLVRKGQHKAQVIRNAHIILQSAQGWTDEQLAQAYGVHKRTVIRVRNHFRVHQEFDLLAALAQKPRGGAPAKFGPKDQALVIATACTPAPHGRDTWTLELLSQVVGQRLGRPISRESVRLMLKKTNYSPIVTTNGASLR